MCTVNILPTYCIQMHFDLICIFAHIEIYMKSVSFSSACQTAGYGVHVDESYIGEPACVAVR